MLKSRDPWTPETLRAAAADHFDRIAQMPYVLELSAEDALRQAQFGKQLVDAALALKDGEVFDLGDWFEANTPTDADKRLVMGTVSFVSGDYLRLLKMEFTHKELGVLPVEAVRALLEAPESSVHEGVTLTKDTVYVQYRRLAL